MSFKKFFLCLCILFFSFSYCFGQNIDSELAAIERLSHRVLNFSKIDSQVYRSGSLTALRDAEPLNELGIRAVISLQEAGEPDGSRFYDPHSEEKNLTMHDIKFYHFPISYTENPLTSTAQLLVLLRSIKNNLFQTPILVHCLAGRDRAGYFAALYRVLVQDWSVSEALSEMVLFNTAQRDDRALEAYRRALEILEAAYERGVNVVDYKIRGPEEVSGEPRVFEIGSYWKKSKRSFLVLGHDGFTLDVGDIMLSPRDFSDVDISRRVHRVLTRTGIARIREWEMRRAERGEHAHVRIHR